MKKTGQFFLTFVPLLLTIALQYFVIFLFIVFSALIESVSYLPGRSADPAGLLQDLYLLWSGDRFNTYVMVAYAISCIAIFGLWYYARYGGVYLPSPKKVFHPLSFVGILLLVPGLQYLSTYIMSLSAALFPHAMDVYMDMIETSGLDSSMTFGLFLYSVLLGPISEELMFRGVTLRQAEKYLPFWAANLFQALLFGIFHMNLIQGIYAFCLGLFLGYVCEKSGSIYNSILLHMLFNFWGTVLNDYLYVRDDTWSILFFFAVAVVLTVLGTIVFTAGARRAARAS